MSYLLTQMFIYLLIAFLLGLLLGWLIWRYSDDTDTGDLTAIRSERDALKKERDDLRGKLDACRRETDRLKDAASSAGATTAAAAAPVAAASVAAQRPAGLDGPRGGVADKLQEIRGIGPQMENLVHSLGFYHFDQIAAWTPAEVAWVDDNLEGFKGRVTRDRWIDQAKRLAAMR